MAHLSCFMRTCAALLLCSCFFHIAACTDITPKLEYIHDNPTQKPTEARFTAKPLSFDEPYLSNVDSSSLESWWFEAVAQDFQTAITVIFQTETDNAVPVTRTEKVTTVFIGALFPNGTVSYNRPIASGAIIASGGPLGRAAAANFTGAGVTFAGTPDLGEYIVKLDVPHIPGQTDGPIRGHFKLTSTSPAHYPCTPSLDGGQSLEVFPHFGWTNAVPSAKASGVVNISGHILNFHDSLGYHDHQWADRPLNTLIQSWYRGHATLGPYNIVFYDGIDSNKNEHVSAYIAKDGEVLLSSCAPVSLKVRPRGRDATYPPRREKENNFDSLHVRIDTGNGTIFIADVFPDIVTHTESDKSFTVWNGIAIGGFQGGKQYKGISVFQEIKGD